MNVLSLIKERARHYRCASCWQPLGANCQVNVLSQNQAHCTAEVTCPRCGFRFVAVFVLTRRKHPDGLPKGPREPISADELLDIHEHLEAFSGSLKDLCRLPTLPPTG